MLSAPAEHRGPGSRSASVAATGPRALAVSVLVVASLLGWSAPSGAAERPRLRAPEIPTVQMVGREALFTTTRSAPHDRTATLLRSVTGGAAARTVLRTIDGSVPDSDLSDEVSHAFEATRTQLAVVRTGTYTEPAATQTDGTETLSVRRRPNGRATRLERCDLHGNPGGAAYALSGSTLVVAGCDQDPRTPSVTVRRPGRPDAALPPPAPGYTFALATAGDFVVSLYADTTDRLKPVARLLERRISTGATVLDIPSPSIFSGDAEGGRGLAVGADGTIVGTTPAAPGGRCLAAGLVVLRPGDPTPHPLPARPCDVAIAFDGRDVSYVGGDDALHVTDLAGHDRIAIRLPHDVVRRVSVDRGRAAIATRRCVDDALFIIPTTGPTRTLDTPSSCPARIRSRRLVVRRHHALVRVTCPNGCRGYLSLKPHLDGPAGPAIDVVVRHGTRTIRVPLSAARRHRLGSRPVATLQTRPLDELDDHVTKARLTAR